MKPSPNPAAGGSRCLLHAPLALALSFVLTACPERGADKQPARTPTASEFFQQVIVLRCERLEACASMRGPSTSSTSGCLALNRVLFNESGGEGRFVVTGAEAARLALAQLATIPCSQDHLFLDISAPMTPWMWPEAAPALRPVPSVLPPPGQRCPRVPGGNPRCRSCGLPKAPGEACRQGECAVDVCVPASGTCRVRTRRWGEACYPDAACLPPAVCMDGVCTRPAQVGEVCYDNPPCTPDALCAQQLSPTRWKCEQRLPEGAPCTVSTYSATSPCIGRCRYLEGPVLRGACTDVAVAGPGEMCLDSLKCAVDTFPDFRTDTACICAWSRIPGSPCELDRECRGFCTDQHICASLTTTGGRCSRDEECGSGFCATLGDGGMACEDPCTTPAP